MRMLLRGGRVFDGTGASVRIKDVLVEDGVIDSVASVIAPDDGATVIDVPAQDVMPGFIDVHTHADLAALSDDGLLPKPRQGVTTVVVGNCAHGCAPTTDEPQLADFFAPVLGSTRPDLRFETFADYPRGIAARPRLTNVVALVAHTPIRVAAMGLKRRTASRPEIADMCARLDDAFAAGAVGFSLGLIYAPGNSANREELLALA